MVVNKIIIGFFIFGVFLSACQGNQIKISFSPCDFIQDYEGSGEIECGFLEVPENHDNPLGRKIKIAFAIIKAKSPENPKHPLIHFSGGPGGQTLTPGLLNNYLNDPFSENRDIILFDQRGIGYSSALPNLDPEVFAIMAGDMDILREEEQISRHMDKIKKMCAENGIGLENYNTYQNARDVGLLMKALGYEKYNLYGGSYGTRLARIVMEMFPEYIHSSTLNSPNPPGGDFLIDRLNSYNLALGRIFEYCDDTPDCKKQYPDLKEKYLSAIRELEEIPIQVDLDDVSFTVNPQDALYILRRQLYRSNSRENAPVLIMELKNGGGYIMKNILRGEYALNKIYNFSMWISVERYEFIHLENTPEVVEQVYDSLELLPAKLGLFNSFYHAGKEWHHAGMTEKEKNLKTSDVPTIIFVNRYDPVTPPKYGHIMQEHLSNSQLFIMDEGGHGGGDFECLSKVIMAFMEDPLKPLDTSCLNLYVE